jgi:pimeloyl-ACP methyl ester carboxylesterase
VLFPAVRHEVLLWHGTDRLVGDLVLPATAGPHPVLVLVSAAGKVERDRSAWLDGLAEAGVATFTWDRSGATRGTQSRHAEPTTARAREVLAVVRGLRRLHEVDGGAIALAGFGTGGWAAAQAATFSDDARALVLACTPVVSPAELAEHRLEDRLREAATPPEEADLARLLLAARLHALATGAVPGLVAERERDQADRDWYRWLPGPGEPGGPDDRLLASDPRPTLSAVGAPVLALFGEQDTLTPLAASVRGVRTALGDSDHDDHEVVVVRGADHALRVRPGHGLGRLSRGRHQFGDWPAGLTEYLARWLLDRLRPAAGVPSFIPPETSLEPQEPTGGLPRPAAALDAAWPPVGSDAASGAGCSAPGRVGSPHGGATVPVRQVRRRMVRD